MGRIIRQLKAELFGLIRLRSGGRLDKYRIMAKVLLLDPSLGQPKELLDQVRDVMRRLKHYSLRTERTYCDWIVRFILFHARRHATSSAGEMPVSRTGKRPSQAGSMRHVVWRHST